VGKTQLENSFVSILEKSFFSSFQQTEKNICKTIAQQKSAQLKEGAILLQQVLRVFFSDFCLDRVTMQL
jgi:sulfur relay (sulfurtransferase) DsrC/TusE family protein